MRFLFLFLLLPFANAEEKKIPFVIKEQTISTQHVPSTNSSQKETMYEVPTGQISEVITNLKTGICPAIGNGEFKVLLKVKEEILGKILVVGELHSPGIEIVVKCGNK